MADLLWPYVALLYSFDSNLTDASAHPVALTNNNCTFDTGVVKFGSASLKLTSSPNAYLTQANTVPTCYIFDLPFTIEGWVNFSTVGECSFINNWSGGNIQWWFGRDGSNLAFYYNASGSPIFGQAVAWTPIANTWYHICAERDAANTLRLYVNGVVMLTTTSFTNVLMSNANSILEIGGSFDGNIDELRVTIGAARYGGAFTPPSAAFDRTGSIVQAGGTDTSPLWADVRLLAHFDSNLHDSSTDNRSLTSTGASFDTTNFKFGTASLNQNFTSGAVTVPSGSNAFTLGTGAFCFECFVYFTATISGWQGISKWGTADEWWFGLDFGSTIKGVAFYYNATFPQRTAFWQPTTPDLNTWYHLCVERDGGNNLWVYVNGTVVSHIAGLTANIVGTTDTLTIGETNYTPRVDEVRLTVGAARYNGVPFLPPITAFDGPIMVTSLAIIGVTSSSAAQSLTVNIKSSMVGVGGTSAAQSLTGNTQSSMIGVAASASVSFVGVAIVALTGVAATAATQPLATSLTSSIVGVAVGASVGAVGSSVDHVLPGVVGTVRHGTLISGLGLLGTSASAAVGTIGISNSGNQELNGVVGHVQPGTLSSIIDHSITGCAATSALGELVTGNVINPDVAASGLAGTLAVATSKIIDGSVGHAQHGTVISRLPQTIISVQAIGHLPPLATRADDYPDLSGAYGTGGVGQIMRSFGTRLTGVVATGATSVLSHQSYNLSSTIVIFSDAGVGAVGTLSSIKRVDPVAIAMVIG